MKEEKFYEEHARKFVTDKEGERIIVQVGNVVVDINTGYREKDRALIDVYSYSGEKEAKGMITIGKGKTTADRIVLDNKKI